MVTITNLSKSFADQILFENCDFQINKGEKVGLVGRNGYGKTTLLKILIRQEEADSGSINLPKNYKLGYLEQHLNFQQTSVIQEAMTKFENKGEDIQWYAEKILFGLGFSSEELSMDPKNLSGGFQVRLNLAKTLFSQPDLLLLDEPTNYLDITSIRWLISFLKNWTGELLMITHDRYFMDEVTTHTMIIHRHKMKKISGSTTKLYEQIAAEEENYEKQRLNEQRKNQDIEKFINRFRAKATLATMVQSRIKMLKRKENHQKLKHIKNLSFAFPYTPIKTSVVRQVENLSFSYDNLSLLFSQLSFSINNQDRIAVIGPNGKGKTTLLRLLHEELTPKTGNIISHHLTRVGYYAQTNRLSLHPENTIIEEIQSSNPEKTSVEIRNVCGTLLFSEDQALKKIKVLSGGEKARVNLGKILTQPVNLLLLDEPTNHLDMDSCDSLLTAIDNFEGAVVMVTHDEMFLHALAERLIIFDNDQVTVFEGTYQEFLNKVGWKSEINQQQDENSTEIQSINRKELRKQKTEIINLRNQTIKPLEKKIEQLTKQIEKDEQSYTNYEQQLISASENNQGDKIQQLSRLIHEKEQNIENNYHTLELIMEEHDTKKRQFDEQLQELENKN
ncbi:MAG: ATP-binding cassette domain-containing protein [Spirochaetes bacterium]|nr:ATP-binding cassette domain-containing protein [Spirochaetota bacterium]